MKTFKIFLAFFVDHIQKDMEFPLQLQTLEVRSKEAAIDLTRVTKFSKKNSKGKKNENKSPGAEAPGPRPRKRWSILETIYMSDDTKKGKKPWSEEVTSDAFWQERAKNSWDTSSGKEDSPKISSRKTLIKVFLYINFLGKLNLIAKSY